MAKSTQKESAIKSTAAASADAKKDNAAAAVVPSAAPQGEAPMYSEGITETEVKAERSTLVSKIKSVFKSAQKLTGSMKDIAVEVVNARAMFIYDGGKDWAGRSQAYRTFINDVFTAAGINVDKEKDTPEEYKIKSDFQNGLRYHVSNRLREVVPADELIRAGLKPETRSERQSASGGSGGTSPSSIGGVRVSEPVGAMAVATARAMAEQDVTGCVTEALSILTAARAFGVPDSADERALLLGKLRELGGLVLAWGHEVETAPAVEAAPEPEAIPVA